MHKHANETRAGAGNSDSCSRLNAATDAAAPGRAFPASRQALQAQPRYRRQHTELDNTNTPDKEDKARAQCEAPHCCVQCEQHASEPPPDTPMPAHSLHSSGLDGTHEQAVP